MRIVFAGTPDFAVPSLRVLIASSYTIAGVLTQPDRAAGRGQGIKSSPVKDLASKHGLLLQQPKTLKDAAAIAAIQTLHADVMVVAAYGLLLPPEVLETPTYGCVNIHASLLPRWRGAAPVQRALLAGDPETGITIMQMDKGLDTGDILAYHVCPIRASDTGGSLHNRLAEIGAIALTKYLDQWPKGQMSLRKQDTSQATYAAKIKKAEGLLDWELTAAVLERTIRAFQPWPVAWTLLQGKPLRIHKAKLIRLETGLDHSPGKVLAFSKAGIDIATGKGALRLLEVQVAGKRRMPAGAFVNAHPLEGVWLGV